MTTSILQVFLRASLLDLGSDDARLIKLQAAAKALASEFARAPASAIPVFLAAIKFEDGESNDAFAVISVAIEREWNTYQSAFQDGTATTLYRAVALQALVDALELQPALGTAIALLMKNFGPWLKLGKFEPAIKLLVESAQKVFDSESNAALGETSSEKSPIVGALKAIKIDRAALQKRLEAAAGPSNRAGQANEKPNASWPNEGSPWSFNFSDQMTAILGEYIDFAISKAAEMDAKNHGVVANRLNTRNDAEDALRLSVNLLWWRQALYSETAEESYRNLSPLNAVVHAVVDFSPMVPVACEPAVFSFLAETILSLAPNQEKLGVNEIFEADGHATKLLFQLFDTEPSVGLVLAALKEKNSKAVCVQPSLPLPQWAIWLLREVLALQAIDNAQPVLEKLGKV